jgi:hypothetical protein
VRWGTAAGKEFSVVSFGYQAEEGRTNGSKDPPLQDQGEETCGGTTLSSLLHENRKRLGLRRPALQRQEVKTKDGEAVEKLRMEGATTSVVRCGKVHKN